MKRREKKLSVMDWVLVGLLDTLAGAVAGGLMAIWQLPSAYRWRGYWAIGGEWLLVIIAIIMAVRLTHAFQMFMIFGGKKHGKMRSVSQGHYRSGGNRSGVRRKVLRQGVRQEAEITRKTSQGKGRYTEKTAAERQIIGQLTVYDILAAHEKSADQNGQRATNG